MKTMTILTILFLVAGCSMSDTTVNKSIHIDAGERVSSCSSVNGSVTVDEGAVISGSCKTVNGSIRIAEECEVRSVTISEEPVPFGARALHTCLTSA